MLVKPKHVLDFTTTRRHVSYRLSGKFAKIPRINLKTLLVPVCIYGCIAASENGSSILRLHTGLLLIAWCVSESYAPFSRPFEPLLLFDWRQATTVEEEADLCS